MESANLNSGRTQDVLEEKRGKRRRKLRKKSLYYVRECTKKIEGEATAAAKEKEK